jgi:hypothetical protein
MKNAFLLFSILLLAAACKTEPKDKSAANGGEVVQGEAEPAVPAENTREAAQLTKDFWVFEYYVIPNDHPRSMASRGLWYNLQMDGTYTYGHWENLLGKGTWTVAPNGATHLLSVDSETDDRYDMQWEVTIGAQGYEASFSAAPKSPQQGVMCKLVNIQTRPTKKQFGYE